MQLNEICSQIKTLHRDNQYYMGQRMSQMHKLGAHIRSILGWTKDAPNANAIEKEAARLVEIGELVFAANQKQKAAIEKAKIKGAEPPPVRALIDGEDDPAYQRFAKFIEVGVCGCQGYVEQEEITQKEMEKLARQLPAWNAWAKDIRGFGPKSLAQIVGEATNPEAEEALGNYATHSKVWKRFGVAVFDGRRQGDPGENASSDDWVRHGYVAKRRALLSVMGDNQIRTTGATYKPLYLARKEFERAKATALGLKILPAAKIPKNMTGQYISEGQIHLRAKRYMEKRLLKHLWQAWRRAKEDVPSQVSVDLPAANEHRDAA